MLLDFACCIATFSGAALVSGCDEYMKSLLSQDSYLHRKQSVNLGAPCTVALSTDHHSPVYYAVLARPDHLATLGSRCGRDVC